LSLRCTEGPALRLVHTRMSGASRIVKMLFTSEDQLQGVHGVHKTLGGACLLHFAYRFVNIGEADMLFGGSMATFMCLCAHLLLSASSLIFRIPLRRIKDGSRIWPEARWHAILFSTRHLCCMALLWYEQRYSVAPMYHLNVLIVFLTIAGADLVNHAYRDSHSNYVRDMQTSPQIKYLFSHVQIGGTVYCLIGQRRFSFHFLAVFVIQFSAFMMTLRRKNIITHSTWVAIYSLILLYGSAVAYIDLVQHSLWIMVVLSNLSTVLRVVIGINKYMLWAGISALILLQREMAIENDYFWPSLIFASYILWISGGIYKVANS